MKDDMMLLYAVAATFNEGKNIRNLVTQIDDMMLLYAVAAMVLLMRLSVL